MRFLLLLLLSALVAAAQAATTTYKGRPAWIIKGAGTTTVTTRLGGEELTVAIHTWQVPVQAGPLSTPRPYTQCTYSQNPCSLTDWIHIRLAGKALWIGPHEIAGLGDMHYLSVAGSPARLELRIAGGDGAAAYDAHLIFDGQHIVERLLYAGFDPAHPFEISRYYYQTIP